MVILLGLELLPENWQQFIRVLFSGLVGLIIGFTIHEFSHALAALGEGDPTARRMGRLTLNPLKHIEPFGFALLLLVGFGWARPVQVDERNLRHGRLGMAWVALAGPLSNFVLAFLLGALIRSGIVPDGLALDNFPDFLGGLVLPFVIFYNLALGVFNLIPLPPLDGSKVVGGLLPRALYEPYLSFERYGWLLLLGLVAVNLALNFALDISIIGSVLLAPLQILYWLATGRWDIVQ